MIQACLKGFIDALLTQEVVMEYNKTVEGESMDQILGKWKVVYIRVAS